MMKSTSKFQLALVVLKKKECDHMHSSFCFDKKGHMIEIIGIAFT